MRNPPTTKLKGPPLIIHFKRIFTELNFILISTLGLETYVFCLKRNFTLSDCLRRVALYRCMLFRERGGGREGERERERGGGGGREGERERERERGGGREGERERGREGGRERERGREGGREGGSMLSTCKSFTEQKQISTFLITLWASLSQS